MYVCIRVLILYRYTLYVTYKPILVGGYILVLFKSNAYTYVTLINEITYEIEIVYSIKLTCNYLFEIFHSVVSHYVRKLLIN